MHRTLNLTARKVLAISLLAVVLVVAPLLGLHAAANQLREMTDSAISDVVSNSHARIHAGLDAEFAHVLRSLEDWSAWDAMYNFALDPANQAWREENFSSDTVATLGLSRIALYDRQGRHILHSDYNQAEAQAADFGVDATPAALIAELEAQSDLTFQRGGLCIGPDGSLSWAAIKPIRHSDRSGPIVGFLLMARPLGDQALRSLQQTAGVLISFERRTAARPGEYAVDDTGRCRSVIELSGWEGSSLGYLSVGTPLHGILERQHGLQDFLLRIGIVAYVMLVTASLLALAASWTRGDEFGDKGISRLSGGRIPVGLTAIAGLVLTVTGMWGVRGWQRDVHEVEFARRAGNCVEQLNRALEGRLSALSYLQAYFHSSQQVEQQEFDRLIRNANLSLAGTRQWAWLPMPPAGPDERDARSIDAAGIIANPPSSAGSLAARIARWAALPECIESARNSGAITTVVVPFDPGAPGGSHVVALVAPVYLTGVDSLVEHRRRDFRGVILNLVDMDDVVADAAANLDSGGITTTVAAVTSRPNITAPVDDIVDGRPGRLWVVPIGAGLSIDLRIISGSRFNYGLQDAVPAGVAAAGVVLTALLCAFMELTLQRTRRVQQLVAIRTGELEAKTRELTTANLAAQSATQAKSAFLANMSHELRTPMTAILGYTDLLSEGQHPPASQGEFIRTIRGSAEHLLTLINDVLDLSKIEAGRMQVELLPCNTARLLDEVLMLLRERASRKGLSLEVEYAGSVPDVIRTDPTRFRQVLVNLVGNAVKFTDSGGVRLIVKMATPQDSPVPLLSIEVMDTGPGIDDRAMSRLFEPFEQGDGSTTRKYGGTGLGLNISRHLAQLLGGTIEASSTPGDGSSFVFTLAVGPLQPGSASTVFADAARELGEEAPPARSERPLPYAVTHMPLAEAVNPPIVPAHTPGGRILLAEDTPDNQRLLSLFLHKIAADVQIVGNGQDAIEQALRSRDDGAPFDLILMDIQMPLIDGYAATRTLRQAGWTSPIIALTAHASPTDRQRCIEAGCDEVMTKPVQRDAFLAMCRSFITTARAPGRQAA
ncbi:MAG TPA: ATP-binding protein [Phycisphaerales bacterium]|nr:ATP-binding protein [Phycisphaerales bacterium]